MNKHEIIITLNEIDAIVQIAERNNEIIKKWRREIELRVLRIREEIEP